MPNTCPQCGTEIIEGQNGCQACGWGSICRVVLKGCSGEMQVSTDIDIGQKFGYKLCGNDAKYMDEIQFRIRKLDENWMIKSYPRVKNKVFVNGKELVDSMMLSNNDIISLNDKAAFINVQFI